MVTLKAKRIKSSFLSLGQNRLLKKSLKKLLGPGLVQAQPQRLDRDEKASFLKDALNSKILETEWLT